MAHRTMVCLSHHPFTHHPTNQRSTLRRSHTGSAELNLEVLPVDLFQSAPPLPANNHDRSPAVLPVPPAGAGDALIQGTDEGMFDEGGKTGRKQKRLEFRGGKKKAVLRKKHVVSLRLLRMWPRKPQLSRWLTCKLRSKAR